MRLTLPCSYVPKHAAPREPLGLEARSVLAVGLAAAVLPLGAAPALADEAPSSSTSGTSASGSSAEPASSSSAKASGRRKSTTSLSFRAPSSARGNAVPVGIRLTADGKAVKNGYVRLEKSTGRGWSYAGRLLTNSQGVGEGTLKVAGASRLRAAYTGSQVRTPAVSPARTVRTSRAASRSTSGDAAVQEASRHVGKPYRYGAVGPDAFDCSGFTRYVYGQLGKSLPHNSRAQEDMARPVSKAEARPGDLVFIQDVAGHVGIYAGDGKMYDAPRSGKTVTLRSIWTSNYTLGRV